MWCLQREYMCVCAKHDLFIPQTPSFREKLGRIDSG